MSKGYGWVQRRIIEVLDSRGLMTVEAIAQAVFDGKPTKFSWHETALRGQHSSPYHIP